MNNSFKILFILMVGLLALAFQGCSKDDDGLSNDDIVGTWKFTEVSTNGTNFIKWPYQSTGATFRSDGTYRGFGYFGTGSGTWKKKGKSIITYIDGKEYLRYEVKEQTSASATLVISMTGSDASIWVRCVKTSD